MKPIAWRRGLMILSGAAVLLTGVAFGDDKDCARLVDVQRGIHCGDSSLMVIVQNICNHAIQISTCVQLANQEWDCGLDRSVHPEKKVGRWACESTGEYTFLGCSRDAPDCNARP